MSLDTAYDGDNIFAKIIRSEIPCVKIWENEKILAFMDVFPQTKGHCLVIHKKAQATNLLDIEPDALSELIVGVRKTAKAVRKGLHPDGVRIAQFNGASAGQTVFHLHFHIIPIYEGAAPGRHGASENGPTGPEALEPIAEQIRAAL